MLSRRERPAALAAVNAGEELAAVLDDLHAHVSFLDERAQVLDSRLISSRKRQFVPSSMIFRFVHLDHAAFVQPQRKESDRVLWIEFAPSAVADRPERLECIFIVRGVAPVDHKTRCIGARLFLMREFLRSQSLARMSQPAIIYKHIPKYALIARTKSHLAPLAKLALAVSKDQADRLSGGCEWRLRVGILWSFRVIDTKVAVGSGFAV